MGGENGDGEYVTWRIWGSSLFDMIALWNTAQDRMVSFNNTYGYSVMVPYNNIIYEEFFRYLLFLKDTDFFLLLDLIKNI